VASPRPAGTRSWFPLVPVVLAAVAFVLRVRWWAHQPTEWDSVHLIWGLDHFNVVQYWPHPPGYWLYEEMGRGVRATTNLDGLHTLLLIGAVASAATVGLTCWVGTRIAGRWVGVAAALLLLTSPFSWFYGSVVSTYSFDALFAVLLLWVAWRAQPGYGSGISAGVLLGLAGGFRQSSLVLLAPLALVAVLRGGRSVRRLAAATLALGAAISAWLVPAALQQPGGLSVLLSQGRITFDSAARLTSVLIGARDAYSNIVAALVATAVAVGFAFAIPVLAVGQRVAGQGPGRFHRPSDPADRLRRPGPASLLVLAILPGLLEATLIHFGKLGYLLVFLPALLLLVLLPARGLRGAWRILASVAIAATCLYNAERFLRAPALIPLRVADRSGFLAEGRNGGPIALTAAEIRRLDADQVQYRDLARVFDPSRDVLVFDLDNAGWRYRYSEYQLPQFTSYFLRDDASSEVALERAHLYDPQRTILVPPGGVAILVLGGITPEIATLVAAGQVHAVQLSSGPIVWTAVPGTRVLGTTIQSGTPAIWHH